MGRATQEGPLPLSSLAARIAGNTALSSVRFIGTALLAVAGSVLIARSLGPTDFGQYRLALGIVWMLEVVSALAFAGSTNKFVAELSGHGDRDVVTSVVRFFMARAAAIYVVMVVPFVFFRDSIARFYRDDALGPLLLIGAFSVLPGVFAGISQGAMQGLQRFREVGTISLVHAAVSFLAMVAVLGTGLGVRGLLILLLVANVFQCGLAIGYLGRLVGGARWSRAAPRDLALRMGKFGALMGGLAILNAVVWERSEIFFLGRFSAASQVAFYSLAYGLAVQARRLLPMALGEALFPVIARLDGMKDEWGLANALTHSTRYMAMLGFPLALAGAFFSAPLIELLFGASYRPAAPLLVILLVAAAAVCIAQPASAVLVAKERYRFFFAFYASLAGLNIALDLLLIPPYAAVGAAVANTVVQVTGAAGHLVIASRLLNVRLPLGNLGRCLTAAALAALPLSLLTVWPLLGGPADVVLMGVVFVVGYPVALAVTGALVSEDFARLGAVERSVPLVMRPAFAALVSGVRACRR